MSNFRNIRIEDYSYQLPDERIAKYPLPRRDSSKLLRYDDDHIDHFTFDHLPDLIPPKTLMIVNDTKVIRARLQFFKPTGGRIEVFCLDPIDPILYEQALNAKHRTTWHCLIGNAKKWKDDLLSIPFTSSTGVTDALTVIKHHNHATSGHAVEFSWQSDLTFGEILEILGELPIPPYLHRETEESDLTTYQTVYARVEGSVAAPTAGLHFTPEVISHLQAQGVVQAEVTLHVGAGTFRPVKADTMGDHDMHSETIAVTRTTIEKIINREGPLLAVGTTSTRTLESLYYIGVHLLEGSKDPFIVSQWEPYERSYNYSTQESLKAIMTYMDKMACNTIIGATKIIIVPGFRYRLVDILVTNFHQPHSTLLLLIAAFVGEAWHRIYDYALSHDFRFLSYGDSSILFRASDHFEAPIS